MPLDLSEDDVMWVAFKISVPARALGADAVELRNWLLRFGCALEQFGVVVAYLADRMANPPPPGPITML